MELPSTRKAVAYRPNDEEIVMLNKLAGRRGLPMSRLIGLAIREMAERDAIKVTKEEIAEVKRAASDGPAPE